MNKNDFVWSLRVYWEDTDAGGVVYHANYLRFLERARTEWLRAKGVDQSELRARTHLIFVVCHLSCAFLAPAALDDQLKVSVSLIKLGRVSMRLGQEIQRGDGAVLLRAEVKAACLDSRGWVPSPLPQGLVNALRSPHYGHD